jgi:hypothetical protein
MRIILTIIYLTYSIMSFAPGNNIPEWKYAEYNELYKKQLRFELMISAIIAVESEGNQMAWNEKEDARGILQIRSIMVKEVNRIVGYSRFKHKDCWSIHKSIEIFKIVQDKHNPTYNLYLAAMLWNTGKLNGKSPAYWKKIIKNLK